MGQKRKSFITNDKAKTVAKKHGTARFTKKSAPIAQNTKTVNNDGYDSDQDYDEIDRFHSERSKIAFNDEDEVSSDNSEFFSDEPVLDNNAETSEESEHETEIKTWGKNVRNYYSADNDAYQEEETEALKLQKKKFSALKEQDFIDESFSALLKSNDLAVQTIQPNLPHGSNEFVKDNEAFFENLIEDYKEKLDHVQKVLEPAIQNASKLKTDQCFVFLNMKYRLWLTYCTNICFYLLLKTNGKNVSDHPVVERLIELRAYIEKSKALEAKLRPQLDRLLNSSNENSTDTQSKGADPLSFKPRPSELHSKSKELDSDQDEIYHPPHIAPVFYERDAKARAKLEESDGKKRKMLKELVEQTSELPDERRDDDIILNSSSLKKVERAEELRNVYEEENFVRLSVDTKEKKRLASSKKKLWNELEDLNEFSTVVDHDEPEEIGRYNGSRREEVVESEVESSEVEHDYESESEIEEDDDDHVKEPPKQKKGLIRVRHNKSGYVPHQSRREGERRPVGSGILKNRGLTPQRSKEQSNPRVRQRKRFEKANKRIKGMKPVSSVQLTKKPYAGERTGIRTDVTKSVRFKH